jgi:hypothetical protein
MSGVTGPIMLPLWQYYESQVRFLYTCYAHGLGWCSWLETRFRPPPQAKMASLHIQTFASGDQEVEVWCWRLTDSVTR